MSGKGRSGRLAALLKLGDTIHATPETPTEHEVRWRSRLPDLDRGPILPLDGLYSCGKGVDLNQGSVRGHNDQD